MIEEKLEIILFTYNRAKYVENTLTQLLNSPFKNCKISILNNHSTDNTIEICEQFQEKFPNYHIITNKVNIGGNPNILRAYEIANAEYTWIIADNDEFNFLECDDTINAITSSKYDVILTCSGYKTENKITHLLKKENKNKIYQEIKSRELLNIIGSDLIDIFTFVPAWIIKTDILKECIGEGYNNCHNLYPHFPTIVKIFEENLLIYKTTRDLVIIVPNPEEADYYTPSGVIIGLLNSSALFKRKELKNKSLETLSYYPFFTGIVGSCLTMKINKENRFKDLKLAVINAKGFLRGFGYVLIISIISITPLKLCKYLFKIGLNYNR